MGFCVWDLFFLIWMLSLRQSLCPALISGSQEQCPEVRRPHDSLPGTMGWRWASPDRQERTWSSNLPKTFPWWLALPWQPALWDLHAWMRHPRSLPDLIQSHCCSALSFGRRMSCLLPWPGAGLTQWGQHPDPLPWVCHASAPSQTFSLQGSLKLGEGVRLGSL